MKEIISQMLNEQVNKEFYSAYLYLSYANYFVEHGLDGFANWYQVQAQEERDHAMLITQYLQNNDAKVVYEAISKPESVWEKPLDVLEAGFAHEKYVTESIHRIYDVASEEKDYRTLQFLDWFVKEQGEEETNAVELIRKMELFGSDAKALYMLDQELGARTYVAPSLTL